MGQTDSEGEVMITKIMLFWQDFLDSLNSDGGHILLLIVLVGFGVLGVHYAVPKADDIYLLAAGSLFTVLKVSGSNKTRRERPVPITETVDASVVTTSASSPLEKKDEVKPQTGGLYR